MANPRKINRALARHQAILPVPPITVVGRTRRCHPIPTRRGAHAADAPVARSAFTCMSRSALTDQRSVLGYSSVGAASPATSAAASSTASSVSSPMCSFSLMLSGM